jgi:hypothetical protein
VFREEHDEKGTDEFRPGTSPGTWPADGAAEAERAAIAIEMGGVPPAYADAWAAFQTRQQRGPSEADWWRAVDGAGRFLDEWGSFALGFGWRASDIFGADGLAWFCAGERVRALGPGMAVTTSVRIFRRRAPGSR